MNEIASQKRARPFRISMLAAASKQGVPLSEIRAVHPWLGLCPTRYKLNPDTRQACVELALGQVVGSVLLDAWWALSYLGWALEIVVVSGACPVQRLQARSLAQVLALLEQITRKPAEPALYSNRPMQRAVSVGG